MEMLSGILKEALSDHNILDERKEEIISLIRNDGNANEVFGDYEGFLEIYKILSGFGAIRNDSLNQPISCHTFLEMDSILYVEDDLDAKTALISHIARCEKCSHEYRKLNRMINLIHAVTEEAARSEAPQIVDMERVDNTLHLSLKMDHIVPVSTFADSSERFGSTKSIEDPIVATILAARFVIADIIDELYETGYAREMDKHFFVKFKELKKAGIAPALILRVINVIKKQFPEK